MLHDIQYGSLSSREFDIGLYDFPIKFLMNRIVVSWFPLNCGIVSSNAIVECSENIFNEVYILMVHDSVIELSQSNERIGLMGYSCILYISVCVL